MSVVPYRARIVYHDRESQILVVHNNLENSVELYGSHQGDSHGEQSLHGSYSGPLSAPKRPFSLSPDLPCCPSCGADLAGIFNGNDGPHGFSRPRRPLPGARNMSSEKGRKMPDFSPFFGALGPANFMHQDYFLLLAELPYVLRPAAKARTLESPASDMFNQGYFERFFRKIPPGVLGCGAHAQVYKVAHVLQGIELGVFAVKRIAVGDHLHFLDQVLNEVLILYELSAAGAGEHNLIRYNHVWMEYGDLHDLPTYILDPDRDPHSVDTVPYVFILQQYCDGGHLEHVLTSNFMRLETMSMKQRVDAERARRRDRREDHVHANAKPWLSDLEVWKFFADITTAVAYLHAHGILHRDLKPSNCLLESRYDITVVPLHDSVLLEADFQRAVSLLPKVLVSDFGEGKFLHKKRPNSLFEAVDEERQGNTGTLEFTDPKLWIFDKTNDLDGKPKFAHKFDYDSDIYSLGMILCFLYVGELPFSDLITDYGNPESVRANIERWHRKLTPELFDAWFDKKTLALKGEVSSILGDFKMLVYLMIKGQEGTPKPSPKIRSGATIVEMGNLSIHKSTSEPNSISKHETDLDELEDDEVDAIGTLNLLFSENERKPQEQRYTSALFKISTHKLRLIRCTYIINLALLEYFALHINAWWITALKLGNAVCLAGESSLHDDYRMHLVGFWTTLTVAAVITL
ncbi:kinase-like protein [Metschnikowia bicuspidata var. bicuspidata NRRL YB-4993]|uniref:Kinase-like protein n=1 Tax=Metschnikowia bicuspidata var. bicuspidata NRRL YB-4993 TaxID=869754 RepID=A0A1A0HGN4_9ASCO|nr:kinase-like protein [Metschnikowia bicuspidata var. bicuspidata NRRL YB-4993]OBA23013.1 kinase-like protein [Metschnikowia bicuspidata var. bicuspidata NRRL YB-4993]